MWSVVIVLGLGLPAAVLIGRWIGGESRTADPDEEALKLFRGTRARPISELREGSPAKTTGEVGMVTEALKAPLTGRRCVAWQVRVWGWHGYSAHNQILDVAAAVEFVLRDGSTEILVQPGERPQVLSPREQQLTGDFGEHDRRVRAFVEERGIRAPIDRIELMESIVPCDGPATCAGFVRKQAAESTYREHVERLVLAPLGRGVVLTDERARLPRRRAPRT
jgi:hypothetical protein